MTMAALCVVLYLGGPLHCSPPMDAVECANSETSGVEWAIGPDGRRWPITDLCQPVEQK
jgi:hypothetical protein